MEKMIGILQDLDRVRIILQASSYEEAIGMIAEMEPDIIITDIFINGKIGFDLLKFLQQQFPGIDVAVVTNHSGTHYREICKKLGAHYFLDKAKEFDMITQIVNHQHVK